MREKLKKLLSCVLKMVLPLMSKSVKCPRLLRLSISVLVVVVSCTTNIPVLSAFAESTITLTPTETRDLLGAALPAKYFDGTDYVDFTFSYGGITTINQIYTDTSALHFAAGDTVIWYSAQISPNTNPQFITVDVRPQYSFFDTEIISQMCGLSLANYPSVSTYSPPSWRWHTSFGGDSIVENQLTRTNMPSVYATVRASINNINREFTFVDISISNQSEFSAYSDRALFYGNNAISGTVYFIVSCPTISADSSMATGTDIVATTGVTGSEINVVVSVDNSGVVSAIDGLATYPAETAGTVETIPSGIDVEGIMTGADDIIDDLPRMLTASGLWLYALGLVFDTLPFLKEFALVLALLSIITYILWKK